MTEFTYYTIIGKDLDLFKSHVENIKNYAGFDKLPCKKPIALSEMTKKIWTFVKSNSLSNR